MNNISKEDFYKRIGKNVAKFRKEKDISQLELSLEMNYKSISIISSAEIYYNGKHFRNSTKLILPKSDIIVIE